MLAWLKAVEKYHPQEPHFYFQYLGVLPEYQGKGMGTTLMRHFTALADEAHMPGYLETASAGALAMYKRYGFETLVETEIIGVKVWFMWRKAKTLPS